MEVAPFHGGRVTRFYLKPAKKELVHFVSDTTAPQGSGLLLDFGKHSWKKRYEWELVEQSENRVAIRLSTTAEIGPQRNEVLLRKTIDLQRGRNSILVRYELTNVGKKLALVSFRLTNTLSPGGPQAACRELAFPFGYLSVHRTANVPPGKSRQQSPVYELKSEKAVNHWLMEPTRPWVGVRDLAGFGAGMETDFPHVDLYYSWFPSAQFGTGFPTAEVFYRPVELRPKVADPDDRVMNLSDLGNVFRQSVRFVPFANLPRFDGCMNGTVAGIEIDGNSVNAHFGAERPFEGTATVLIREPDGFRTKEVGHADIKIVPGKETECRIGLDASPAGKVVMIQLRDEAGQAVAEFERPADDKAAAAFSQMPFGERAPRALGTTPDWHPAEWQPTPHTRWARPYHKGPVKALCVNPGRAMADLLELEQRMDIDIDYLPLAHPHVFAKVAEMGRAPDPAAAFPMLLDGKRSYDVIILAAGIYWDVLPERMRNLILERVREGTGLVFLRGIGQSRKFDQIAMQPIPDGAFKHGVLSTTPWEVIPKDLKKLPPQRLLRFRRLGKGTVVECLWSMWIGFNRPYKHEGFVPHPVQQTTIPTFRYWEYSHALLARLIYFAGGKQPDTRLVSLALKNDKPALAGKSPGQIELKVKSTIAEKLEAEACVFDSFHRKVGEARKVIEAAPTTVSVNLDLPAVTQAGAHPVEVRLLKNGKTVDWGAMVIPVRSGTEIAAISTTKPVFKPGEAPEFLVDLENSSGAIAQVAIRTSIRDCWSRLVVQKSVALDVPPSAGKPYRTSIQIPPFNPLNPYHRAAFELTAGGKPVSERRLPFTIDVPLPLDYTFICWSGYSISSHYTDRRHLELVRSIGYDVYSMYQTGEIYQPYSNEAREASVETVTRTGLRPLAQSVYPIHAYIRKGMDMRLRPEPLCDAAFRAKTSGYIRRAGDAAKRFKLFGMSSGDEPSLGWYDRPQDFDQSPQTLVRFRAHLKKAFPNLNALNATWKRSFKTWEKVVPDTFAEARNRNHFAAWADHRLYMETELTDYLKFFRDEVRKASGAPMALSGMGFGGIYNGFDISRLMPLLNHSSLYGDGDGEYAKPEIQRSFQPKGALNGVWIGYGNTEEWLRSWIWLQALSDKFLISVYSSTFQVRCERYLTERGRFFRKLFREYRDSGTGTILRAAERQEDPIAILYSKPCVMAAAVSGLSDRRLNLAAFRYNRDAWARVVHDIGLNSKFVSNWQITDGHLKKNGTKVLILPLAQSILKTEANAIRDFVRGGGLLIADARAGVFDGHCVPYESSPLDEVFGFDRSEAGNAPAGNFIRIGKTDHSRGSQFKGVAIDSGIKLRTGRRLGAGLVSVEGGSGDYGTLKIRHKKVEREVAGAFYLNRYGNGAAVYGNFLLGDFRRMVTSGTADQVYTVVGDLVRNLTDLKPPAKVLLGDEILPDSHTVCYRNGRTWLVAVQRHTYSYRYARLTEDKPEAVTVRLPVHGHVYEVWNRKWLGEGTQVQDTLEPGARRLYVVLPYKVTGLRLTANDQVNAGKSLKLQAAIVHEDAGQTEEHCFRITVTKPDGTEAAWFTRNLRAQTGKISIDLPMAIDAQAGNWVASVRDILTGATAEKAFKVTGVKE
jgi:hypothetical protein